MYITIKRKIRLSAIIVSAAVMLMIFTGCDKKPTPTQSPVPSKSPSASVTPGVTSKPTQTDPATIVLPTSAVNAVHVSGLSIDKELIELSVGQSFALSVGVEPDLATRKTINWTSGNEAVATVSKTNSTTATVTAVSPGTVLIKAASEDSGKIAACIVTVRSTIVEVTSITLSSTDLMLTLGSTYQIKATIQPANAANKALSWTSSAPAVAMASDDGTIMATGLGTAVITVKSSNGKSVTCNIRVIEALTGITVSPTAQSMKIGGTLNLNVNVSPAGAAKPKLIWSSSKPAVATVSEGAVTGIGVGESVITVKTEDGKFSAYCTVYVSR